MGRELFIVSRDRADLYRYLTQTFAGAENVEIIWDRRAGDRRIQTEAASTDRRRAERRARRTVEADLKAVGYAFLALDD
jgi:hypothetical protein